MQRVILKQRPVPIYQRLVSLGITGEDARDLLKQGIDDETLDMAIAGGLDLKGFTAFCREADERESPQDKEYPEGW